MKICERVKQTGVHKETLHFYIRVVPLRKPGKSGVNAAGYNEFMLIKFS
jgi:DNA-binding transcriptional MerR regulator